MIRLLARLATSIPIIGTVLSLIRHPHWIFRLWDFPRVQMATLMSLGAPFLDRRRASDRMLLAAAAGAVAWQIHKIHPYTKVMRKQVKDADREDPENSISVMMSNVLMENDQYEKLIELVRSRQPDVLLAVETDKEWTTQLEREIGDDYPHRIKQAQDNYYGMVLLSRLEMKGKVRFLVQDDIPSIHARIKLRSGVDVELRALHPRPPEPLRDQRSTPRDAELVVVGRAIEKKRDVPTIVAGDLNDVAWSDTSELFVRLSGLLDPRIGRGFYNSYNAKNPLARFPLDHIFHSNHFKLIHLERLPPIGSDHFPIFAHLLFDPEAPAQQAPAKKKAGDEKQASKKLAREREDAARGKDRPSNE